MLNIGQMMKQVKDMQGKMTAMQAKLAETEKTGQAGGDAILATMNGKGDLLRLKIDPKLVDPSDIEMLEDTIIAACRDAKAQIDAIVAGETEKAMGGVKLPAGLSLPF